VTEDAFNPYVILGVDPSASEEEIKQAYRRAAQEAHPDRKVGSPERMSLVNQAYQLLSDPAARAAYDSGKAGMAAPASLERRAKDFLLVLAGMVIRTAPLSANMVALIMTGITNQQQSLRESRAKTLSEIEGLRQRIRRLKGPPHNFIEDLMKQEIASGERLLVTYDSDELVMVKALEILRDFSWEEYAQTPQSTLLSFAPNGQPIYLIG
jgi:curved DNA-binding protein CbpA